MKEGRAQIAVAWRHSLVTRVLAVIVVVAAAAVAATAWLTVHTTTRAISGQQSRSIAEQDQTYVALVGYAAQHRTWAGVQPVLRRLAARDGDRIVLTTPGGELIGESGRGPALHGSPAAVVDALDVDPSIVPRTLGAHSRIDPRATGPYRLSQAERARLGQRADAQVACAHKTGVNARRVTLASGRSEVDYGPAADTKMALVCETALRLAFPVASERAPLRSLSAGLARCLGVSVRAFRIEPDFSIDATGARPLAVTQDQVDSCLNAGLRAQFSAYVAPAAWLYLDQGPTSTTRSVDLTAANVRRIVVTSALVLLLALVAALVLGRRLSGPLRQLTTSTLSPASMAHDFDTAALDEIGVLSRAMAVNLRKRTDVERQRRALVADVAHEMRSPLTVMRGWLEAADAGLADRDPELIGLLLGETVLLQRLIDDLRDLAAADAGTLRVHPQLVDIDHEVELVVDGRSATAAAGEVDLTADLQARVLAQVDGPRVRQVVGNLVDNALTHTPPGGEVVVSSRTASGHVEIEVRDSGLGIGAADLAHVFDRFWRADRSRSRATGGSGLGLAVSQQLVLAHGGTIAVQSELGLGTRVTVRLPLGSAPTGS